MADSKMKQQEEEESKRRKLKLISYHYTINAMLSLLTFNTRTTILRDLTNGNAQRMSSYMSTWSLCIGAAEFLLNPTVGRLSDTYGRKFWMCLSPVVCTFLKALVLIRPTLFTISLEKIICDGLRPLCGTTMVNAALADTVPREELKQAFASMLAYVGISVVGGPLIGGALQARFGSSGPYLLATILSIGLAYMNINYLEETLQEDKKRPFKGIASPFAILQLFTNGSKLALASTAQLFSHLCEAKNLGTVNQLYQLNQLGWDSTLMSGYTMTVGLGFFFGSPAAKWSMKTFGDFGHTTMTNIVSILNYFIKGFIGGSTSMWFGQLLNIYGGTRNNALRGTSSRLGSEAGIGKGEYSGLHANLRALCVFISPLIWSNMYTMGLRNGNGGFPYIGCGISIIISELLQRRLASGKK